MMSLEGQLRGLRTTAGRAFGPISVDEIASPIVPPGIVDVGSRPSETRLGRGIGWAVAAFVFVVLAVGGMYFAFAEVMAWWSIRPPCPPRPRLSRPSKGPG